MNFQTLFKNFIPWFLSRGIRVALILIVAYFINRFLRVFVEKAINRLITGRIDGEDQQKRAHTLISIFTGTLKFIISILALLMVLPEFGINIAPILAGIGVMGLAVGMAAQNVIADFIAGIFILLEDQYRIGDKIEVAGIAGVKGEVIELTLRRTTLRDDNGNFHSIPNSQIKTVTKRKE